MRQFRRWMGILLSICLIAVMIPAVPVMAEESVQSIPFKDVPENSWFSDSVMYVFEKGMMKGMSEDTFEPQTATSRAMVVTILHRLEGSPEASQSGFEDIPAGKWYEMPVCWAASSEIVKGMDEKHFGPDLDVTREQIATFLYRYASFNEYDTSVTGDVSGFHDKDEIHAYAQDSITWAVGEGLIAGRGNDQLAPLAKATRAEIATILMRFCERYADEEGDPDPDEDDESVTAFLDAPVPEIEIYSFDVDNADILIGTEQYVTFSAEIFLEKELEEDAVAVYDPDDQPVGSMQPDEEGIFKLTTLLSSDTVGLKEYYVRIGELTSAPCTVNFYREYTDEDMEQRDALVDEMSAIVNPFLDEDGYAGEDNLSTMSALLHTYLEEQLKTGKVKEYGIEGTAFSMTTGSGFPFVFCIPRKGYLGAPMEQDDQKASPDAIQSMLSERIEKSTANGKMSSMSIATYDMI